MHRGGVAWAAVVGPGGDVACVGEGAHVWRAVFEFFKTRLVEVAGGGGGVERRHVDVFHALPHVIVHMPWGVDHEFALPGARAGTLVEQVASGDAQVAIGGQQAVAVLHVVALQHHVLACDEPRRDRVLGCRFKVGFVDGDFTAPPIVVLTAVLHTHPGQAAGGEGLAQFKCVFGVLDKAGVDADGAYAFYGA